LQAGLDQILRRFEVVDVKNYFNVPGRLGLRYVEVLVIMQVGEGENRIPHICEIRLEELCFHKAQELSAPHMENFNEQFRHIYNRAGRDTDALKHLVRMVLSTPKCSHNLRVFRCHLAHRYGSTICAWRRYLGGGRLLSFTKFREVCQQLNCGEHSTELWQGLDPSLGGCISMFELDPEATALLVKFRNRMTALADVSNAGKNVDPELLFARLCFLVRPRRVGHLEKQEFRSVTTPLGISKDEAFKVFSHLDHRAGLCHPATITVADTAWLSQLPNLVDANSVTISSNVRLGESDVLRQLTWARATKSKRGEVLKWNVVAEAEEDTENQDPGQDKNAKSPGEDSEEYFYEGRTPSPPRNNPSPFQSPRTVAAVRANPSASPSPAAAKPTAGSSMAQKIAASKVKDADRPSLQAQEESPQAQEESPQAQGDEEDTF